ncbi:MAG: EamA family transporter [Bacilli bacterium]|nr:EamA family transporter [Bacilli bacterium]
MKLMNNWLFWVIVYLISAVIFAQTFKKANRKMKNAGSLTILLEIFTALFAILFIPLFEMKFPPVESLIILGIVVIIYALTDRLNIEARYGLDPSVFSMLKQLSTVFLIILGFIFLNEEIVLKKIIGSIIIIFANILLTFESGKFKINKYFIMSLISNFLFAIAMLINVNISDNFNLGIYTIITVSAPALLIFIFERHSLQEIKKEFKRYNKIDFLISAFTWCIMLISSVRAYQIGNVSVVAPLLTLTAILNTIYEYFVSKNKTKIYQKIIAAILIIFGVILIKI